MKWKNRFNHSIKACEKNYFHACFEDDAGKAEATWNGINVILSPKNSFAQPSKLAVIDYKEITDSHELSNGFSKHYRLTRVNSNSNSGLT